MDNWEYRAGRSNDAGATAKLVYESSHELFNFMFGDFSTSEKVLQRLLSYSGGHFGADYATVMESDGKLVGIFIGYSKAQLSSQELKGTLNMLRAAPFTKWLHLATVVSKALDGYVPPPSDDAFYINNIAIDSAQRGNGLGKRLLAEAVNFAKNSGQAAIELDVTEPNVRAQEFYKSCDFLSISQSGTSEMESRYGLPKLNRMRLNLA